MTEQLNISTSHPTRFRLSFPYLPFLGKREKGKGLLLYCSEVTLPGLEFDMDKIPTGYYDRKEPKGDFTCDDLLITYSVDELFNNYYFLLNWFLYIKNPERFLVNNLPNVNATLHILSNNGNIKSAFTLKNIVPYKLDPLNFSTKIMDTKDLEHKASFSVEYFKPESADGN